MTVSPDSPATVLDTAFFRRWLSRATDTIRQQAAYLTDLDSPIGDADHGANMRRGFESALASEDCAAADTPGALLKAFGTHLTRTVGGASGPLYGTVLRRAAKALGDEATASPQALGEALAAAVAGVRRLGDAAPGDATMIDALHPAAEAYAAALEDGADVREALAAAARAARAGAEATVPLQARRGRASYLGERSIGHQDPGATSSALLIEALHEAASGAAPGGTGGGVAGAPADEAPEAAITGSAPQAGTAGTGSAMEAHGGGTAGDRTGRDTGTGDSGPAAEPPAGAPPGAAASEPAPDAAALRPEEPGGGTGLGTETTDTTETGETGDEVGTGAGAVPGPDKAAGSGAPAARVGVVLVSHSREVAGSTAALAEALVGAGTPAPVAVAGGTEDGRVGTSAVLVRRAVEQVHRGRGVVVLCDMGSAVLTVKSLLADTGPGSLPADVRIADAPFVEGAVAALVTASTGADLALVLSAADDARTYRKL